MVRYSWTRWQHCTACTEFIISIAFISNSTCPVSRTGSSKISSGYRNFTFRVNCSKRDGDSLKNSVKLMLPRRLQCLALLYSFNYYFFLLFFFFFFRFTEAARSSLFHFAINTQFSRWMKKEKEKREKKRKKEGTLSTFAVNVNSSCEEDASCIHTCYLRLLKMLFHSQQFWMHTNAMNVPIKPACFNHRC